MGVKMCWILSYPNPFIQTSDYTNNKTSLNDIHSLCELVLLWIMHIRKLMVGSDVIGSMHCMKHNSA